MAKPENQPLAGKRIALLAASASRLGGGVFEALVSHVRLLRDTGATPILFAGADRFTEQDRARFGQTPVHAPPTLGSASLAFAPALSRALDEAAPDLLHLHGIWQYPSLAAARWARRTGKPYLISPHGMLEPWVLARGRWKKACARLAYEQASWQAASGFHALCPAEAQSIMAATGRKDCIVIANPAPAPLRGPVLARAPQITYLGRIHPKKNLAALLAAWAALADTLPGNAELVLAGWGAETDVAALRAMVEPLDKVRFIGPVFGAAKQRLLEESAFLILPSFSEGLPMTMLESWAAATPTLMSRHCNLDLGFASGAAIDCGTAKEDIAAALSRAFALSGSAWMEMAHAARALAENQYSASAIARQWEAAYLDLIAANGEGTGDA